tara:strand:- start:551 stop:721 length:171 start_codon:yes stop_codon:yes gene_type:complete
MERKMKKKKKDFEDRKLQNCIVFRCPKCGRIPLKYYVTFEKDSVLIKKCGKCGIKL